MVLSKQPNTKISNLVNNGFIQWIRIILNESQFFTLVLNITNGNYNKWELNLLHYWQINHVLISISKQNHQNQHRERRSKITQYLIDVLVREI